MKKPLLSFILILSLVLAFGLIYSSVSHSSVVINGKSIEGPLGFLGSLWGLIISGIVLFLVGGLLIFIFSTTGFLLLGVFALVGIILSLVFLPIFLPLLVPLAIIWAIFRKPKNTPKEEV